LRLGPVLLGSIGPASILTKSRRKELGTRFMMLPRAGTQLRVLEPHWNDSLMVA
jgi:hypothetical protein